MTALEQWISENGSSQTDLAKRAGISQSYASMIVRGERRPSLDVAVRLSEVTGLDVRELAQPKVEAPAEELAATE